MATPAPIVSNPVTVTEDGVLPTISITVSPTEVSSGGIAVIAGQTNLSDGMDVHLLASIVPKGQPAGTYADTGLVTKVGSGTFTFSYTTTPNNTTDALDIWLEVSTGVPAPAPTQ